MVKIARSSNPSHEVKTWLRLPLAYHETSSQSVTTRPSPWRCKTLGAPQRSDQWQCVVNCLADAFAADNGMFKRERFKRACEPGANVRER